jgi:adducin
VIDAGTSCFSFQQTGYVIHSAIHESRPDLKALMHIHSRAGVGVSCSVDKIVPICQHSVFIEPVSYHPFRGIVTEQSEKLELAENFKAPSKCLLMKNHGLLAGGATIEEAFFRMLQFHIVCQAYIDAGYTHRPVPADKIVSQDIVEKSVKAATSQVGSNFGKLEFKALARQLDAAGYETGVN